ncbi:MAG: DNA helicase [Microbacterium sp.]|uniref:DNA helicase n=1 Tax=Microbacterium sp. TaxID=51671 RepID=UPI0039E22AA9
MSVSRKRKKELRKLQSQATKLWESQQVLVDEAGAVAREAGRQLGNYGREQVAPTVQAKYEQYAAPYVDQGVKASKHLINDKVVPATGAVVGSALSVWDAANRTRQRLASGRTPVPVAAPKKSVSPGGVIAIALGAAAALGVLYAAWQTLRADDELWVADDPLRAPEA